MCPHYKNKAWGQRGPDCHFVSRSVLVCIGPLDAKTTKPAVRRYVTWICSHPGRCLCVSGKSFGVNPPRPRATPSPRASALPHVRLPPKGECCCPLGGVEAPMHSGHDRQPVSASPHTLYQGETHTEPVQHQSVCTYETTCPQMQKFKFGK